MGSLYINRVIQVAESYNGYHEGAHNWNIFADILDKCGYYDPQTKQNLPWCCNYVNACMLLAATPEDRDNDSKKYDAQYFQFQPSYNNYSAVVQYYANYFKQAGEYYYSDPKKGDVIFFNSVDDNGRVIEEFVHVGLVTGLSDEYIVTQEGNAGDMVQTKYYTYDQIGSKINGFGRPRYDGEIDPDDIDHKPDVDPEPTPEPEPDDDKVTVELDVLERYSTGEQVTTLKALLKEFGYTDGGTLELDGDFDWATEQAVKKFQRMHDLEETGIVDEVFWNMLLK